VGDDPAFAHALRGSGLLVETLRVRAHDTKGPMHTLYVARPRPLRRAGQSPNTAADGWAFSLP
jgi:hypothetical protein